MLADISWTNQGFSGLIGEMVSVSREEFNFRAIGHSTVL